MFKNGSIIGAHNATTSSQSSGIFDLNSISNLIGAGRFPTFGRAGLVDSNHVHTVSLNTATFAPTIHYIVTTGNDDSSNFSVMDFNFTSGSTASHTIYIGNKINQNSSAFHNDLVLGAIQVLQGETVKLARGGSDLSNPSANASGMMTTVGTSITSTDPTALGFTGVGTTVVNGTWSIASSTGSNQTGATDGIATAFANGSQKINNAGEEVIAQVQNRTYIFCEATQQSASTIKWLKLPSVNLDTNTAHTLSLAYHLAVESAGGNDDEDDELLIYIEN